MTMTSTERFALIWECCRAATRHRLSEAFPDILDDETIDSLTTDDDRRFVMKLLRKAEPLYPLPKGIGIDAAVKELKR